MAPKIFLLDNCHSPLSALIYDGPHFDPGPKFPKMDKFGNFIETIETLLGGKVQKFYAYSHSIFEILLNFLITVKFL